MLGVCTPIHTFNPHHQKPKNSILPRVYLHTTKTPNSSSTNSYPSAVMGGASRLIMLLTTPFPSLLLRHPLPRRLFTTTTTLAFPRPLRPPLKSSSSLHTQPTTTSTSTSTAATTTNNSNSNNTSSISASHPWPEWSHLINTLLTPSTSAGRQGFSAAEEHAILPEDAFVAYEEKQLSTDFVKDASALLAFAHHNPNLLRELSRRNIEVVVSNGTPFLFKTALETARRMRAFLGVDGANVLESDKANTVDLMKYILSYASNPTVPSERSNIYSRELVESSVRNLLCELTEVNCGTPVLDQPAGGENQFPGRYGQTPRPLNQNIVMKRGDWTCPKCNFMNFARNNTCLECEEPRPKRQLTGGEWECPQCDFFNYGRNTVCLRCDCKRPGPALINPVNSMPVSGYKGDYAYKTNIDSRLAENEEKAQRWFSKVSQLDNASDVSSGAADEDFPEIMPLRKGENKFVVSTRKTPLERRLANAPEGKVSQLGGTGNNLDKSIRRSLDQILGRSAAGSPNDDEGLTSVQNSVTENSPSLPKSGTSEYGRSQEGDSNYVPFVPLPADMFSNKNQKMGDGEDTVTGSCSEASSQTDSITLKNESGMRENSQLPEKLESQLSSINKEKEQADKSEIWFKRMAELHNVKDLPSAVSDEDFPEIMPMRKGENRFVVSKKKDRSLTSPTYRRQQAMEQANTTKYVPFVPFPPGYFAGKDSQPPSESDSSVKPTDQVPSNAMATERSPPGLDNARYGVTDVNAVHKTNDQQSSSVIGNSRSGDDGIHFNRNSNQRSFPQVTSKFGEVTTSQPKNYAEGLPNGNPWKEATTQSLDFTGGSTSENSGAQNTSHSMSASGASPQVPENQNVRSGWTGKSLEGSAVTEPDPLDMSEEAKAERWFRRSAQIKDISELSQIPDEDFPSIMPMRKGVNRFVVSKRKTPLERRLTSPQYRRNLPVVSSDPTKKDNNNNSETK